jgi:hypothetical protein
MKSRLGFFFVVAAAVTAIFIAGCGVKSLPLPPEAVRPEQIIDLRALPVGRGIQITWSRPQNYAGGQQMRDLGSFTILRADGDGPYQPLVQIPITDRERFAVATTFSYFDNTVKKGQSYRYQVVSSTTDGYDSLPSNEAEIIFGRPHPSAEPAVVPPLTAMPPSATTPSMPSTPTLPSGPPAATPLLPPASSLPPAPPPP